MFKTKKKHHNRILHIQNSLGTKLQLDLIILIFGPNKLKKGILNVKIIN